MRQTRPAAPRVKVCRFCLGRYTYPGGGGYFYCKYCRERAHRTGSAYQSRQCVDCQRDYLFPFYGGYKRCNDCTMWTDRAPSATAQCE